MILGRVVGTVWGTCKSPELKGFKLLEVRPVKLEWAQKNNRSTASVVSPTEENLALSQSIIVAVDRLDAGIGDYVIVATGTRVRNLIFGERVPVKSLVIGVVDGAAVQSDEVSQT